MRVIDADALINKMCHHCEDGDGEGACAEVCRFAESVSNTPTLDYEPVRHGEWKETGCNTFCRSCGEKPLYDYFGKIKLSHYCPNCGTKMDGGKDNAKVD